MGKSLSHSAQTLAALHYRFWCHTSPVLCMKQKIILKLGFNHFKIKFLLGNIINPCRTGWLFRMSSSYTFLFAETDRHVRFVRFPKFQPLTPTSSYNTLPTKIQNFTLIMGWQLLGMSVAWSTTIYHCTRVLIREYHCTTVILLIPVRVSLLSGDMELRETVSEVVPGSL